jgi:hypothetical protein
MRNLLISLVLLAGLGCNQGAESTQSRAGNQPGEAALTDQASAARSVPEVAIPPDAAPQPQPQGPTQPGSQSMIIRTGRASLEVDSLEIAIAAVRDLAARVGGYVGGSSVEGGDDRLRAASLELRIPAPRWAEVIRGLNPIGKLESVSEEAQDVGEEFVDVTARLTNARRLETRLTVLLDQRTGKLEDVLAVERELARVREEIERYEGRLRYLSSRVATSTLVVYLHEAAPLVGAPGENILVDAFRQAWRNFVQFLAWLISASGVLIPLAVLAILAWLLVRRFRWWRRRPPNKEE